MHSQNCNPATECLLRQARGTPRAPPSLRGPRDSARAPPPSDRLRRSHRCSRPPSPTAALPVVAVEKKHAPKRARAAIRPPSLIRAPSRSHRFCTVMPGLLREHFFKHQQVHLRLRMRAAKTYFRRVSAVLRPKCDFKAVMQKAAQNSVSKLSCKTPPRRNSSQSCLQKKLLPGNSAPCTTRIRHSPSRGWIPSGPEICCGAVTRRGPSSLRSLRTMASNRSLHSPRPSILRP